MWVCEGGGQGLGGLLLDRLQGAAIGRKDRWGGESLGDAAVEASEGRWASRLASPSDGQTRRPDETARRDSQTARQPP